MRNAVLMVFRISIFCRTFAAETFAIVKLYIKWVYIVGAQVLGGELWFN